MTSEFDGIGNHALMSSAEAIAAGGSNLELGAHELTKKLRLFIVDIINVFLANIAIHN